MAEPRLGPDELDRLEDALEGLEDLSEFNDPSDAVAQRLADFQLILQASREALPLEDVRPGLLDGVLAEANLSAQDMAEPLTPSPAPREGWWARLRKSWLVPTLAVAGSAALVLVLAQPMLSQQEPAAEGAVAAKTSVEAEEQAVAAPRQAAEPSAAEPAADPPAPPPPPASARPAAPEPEPEPEPELAEKKTADAADSKGQGWDAVEKGDGARTGGDCFSARNHYARALDDANDSVRARAYVGMGLCKQEEGNAAAAEEYFRKARELDADALDYGQTQSKQKNRSRPTARKPKRKSAKKRKSKLDFESSDPLNGL